MRALILILIVAVVAILAAVGTGFVNINQTRPAQAPDVSATHNGIVAKGGQAPAFDVETGSVKVGSKETNVKVPALEVVPPQNQAANAVANNAM
jgi:flagellar basal body-associated protein FliL